VMSTGYTRSAVTPMTDHEHPATETAQSPPAPGELRLVQELINTHDLETREDVLREPAALAPWLAERELADPGARFTAADVRRIAAVREGLRQVALTHNGAPADAPALGALQEEADRAPLAVRFGPAPALEPARDGIAGAIARLLAIVSRAEADGTWARFKACPAEACQWAFYDHSRNRSRSWCSMEVCGNRAKARAYRERSTRA
jgi:predicted RNA-binding Zn ribbon-like protein